MQRRVSGYVEVSVAVRACVYQEKLRLSCNMLRACSELANTQSINSNEVSKEIKRVAARAGPNDNVVLPVVQWLHDDSNGTHTHTHNEKPKKTTKFEEANLSVPGSLWMRRPFDESLSG